MLVDYARPPQEPWWGCLDIGLIINNSTTKHQKCDGAASRSNVENRQRKRNDRYTQVGGPAASRDGGHETSHIGDKRLRPIGDKQVRPIGDERLRPIARPAIAVSETGGVDGLHIGVAFCDEVLCKHCSTS